MERFSHLQEEKKRSLFSSEVVTTSNHFLLKEDFCQLLKKGNIFFSNKTQYIYLKSQVGWNAFCLVEEVVFFLSGSWNSSAMNKQIFFKKWNFPLRKFQKKFPTAPLS